jgi:hypothetical protein
MSGRLSRLATALRPPDSPVVSRPQFAGFIMMASLVPVALLLGLPVHVEVLQANQEISWQAVVLDASARGLRFGVDVVYTFGPLADAYVNLYHPDLWLRGFLLKCSLLALLGIAATWLTDQPDMGWPRRWLAALSLVLVPATQMRSVLPDVLFLAVGVGLQVGYLHRPTRLRLALMAGFSAPVVLVKFSFVPLLVSALAVCLAAHLPARSRFMHAATLTVALPLAWLLTGQRPGDLVAFVTSSWDVASGYSGAMALWSEAGWPEGLYGAALLAGIVATGATHLRAESPAQRAALTVVLGLSAFLAFKASFVRHDAHVWIASGWVASVGVAIAMLAIRPWPVAAVSLLLAAAFWIDTSQVYGEPVQFAPSEFRQRVTESVTWLRHPRANIEYTHRAYLASADAARQDPAHALAATHRLRDFDAPNQIPAVLAADQGVTLRPMFQSVAAYTPRLAARNAAFLQQLPPSSRIALQAWSIDDRHPGLQHSGSWEVLLNQFTPVDLKPPLLVLEKWPGRSLTCTRVDASSRVGEWLELPPATFVIASPKLRLNAWGTIRRLAYREPLYFLQTRQGTQVRQHRYIAGQGEAGFLLRPLIEGPEGLPTLWTASPTGAAPDAVLLAPYETWPSYQPDVAWSLTLCTPSQLQL